MVDIKRIEVMECSVVDARKFIAEHHSRLPKTQVGPWQAAFGAFIDGDVSCMVGAALWHNPSARLLPSHWLELRRMACSVDAPYNTASKMLGWMTRFFKKNEAERDKCISYQDVSVHLGTIYKAANWFPEYFSRPRCRDRSKNRVGTKRKYRSDMNSQTVAAAGKIRWSFYLRNDPPMLEKVRLMYKVINQSKKEWRVSK